MRWFRTPHGFGNSRPSVAFVLAAVGLVLAAGVLWGQKGSLKLPERSEAEWEALEKEPPLGGTLFPGRDDGEPLEPEPEPAELAGLVPEEVLKTASVESLGGVEELPQEWMDDYFPEKLMSRLVDPQSFLTQSRRDGVLHFLDYHFREARSTIHILVLGPRQRLPANLSLEAIHRRWFGDQLSVLVVYNFGNPGMSRLVFGPEVEQKIAESYLSNAVLGSIDQALVAANAEDQLERFLMELSRRLYWIELQYHGEAVKPQPAHRVTGPPSLSAASEATKTGRKRMLWYGVLAVCSMTVLMGGAAVSWRRHAANKTYFFPERRGEPRLGCPCGGGNRLVVSFSVKGPRGDEDGAGAPSPGLVSLEASPRHRV